MKKIENPGHYDFVKVKKNQRLTSQKKFKIFLTDLVNFAVYLPSTTLWNNMSMIAVSTLGSLNDESFCECVLSSVKLVVSDLHVSLKPSEIRMLVILRMNRGFMEYMRKTYPNTPLSEFRAADAYVLTHGLDALVDDEEEEKDEEV